MKFLKEDMKGYERMWGLLAEKFGGSRTCENPLSGEVWQYMGSSDWDKIMPTNSDIGI